jgi:tetratricopeptide (TPR) repeat protein/transcriptional regulator with XRE-family HTH domain
VPDEDIDPLDTFGTALRRVRRAQGLSLRALGLMVHYSKGHLSKLENGIVPASLDLAEACDAALQAGGRLTAAFLAEMSRVAALPGALLEESLFDIPPAPSHFIGRDADTARVIEAILRPADPHRAPVVLMHGMPGIGKTALALHVAHAVRTRYPGGCLFVEFGSRRDPRPASAMHARLLRRLGVAPEAIPEEPGEARALYLSTLYRRAVLVVADDVTSTDQVAALVPASAACAVIATSRRRLDALDDGQPIRLRPLAVGDAVALFRAVAGRGDPGSEPDYERIAAACGGVPLAVRIAAAKFSASGRSAAEVAELLECPATVWDELDDSERSMHRTLQAELEVLPESGQLTLAMLGLHPASRAGRHSIAWLAGSSPQAVGAEFGGLQRHDLITVDDTGRASAQNLVRMLVTSVASRLDAGSRAQALRRMVAGYARTASAADGAITPLRFRPPAASSDVPVVPVPFGDRAQAMAWCRAEAESIPELCSVAFSLGLDADCWQLAYAMRGYFFFVKAFGPWVRSHRTALMAAERCGDRWAQATTRNNLGLAYVEQGRITAAETQYRRALELLRALDDRRGVATTLGHQAWASHAAGHHEAAISLAEQAIALNRCHDDRRSLAIMDRTAALTYSKSGQHREALRCLAECQEILSEFDLPLDVAMTLNCMGEVYCAMGYFDRARAFHALAAEQSTACGGFSEHARAVRGLAVTGRAVGADIDVHPAGRG